MYLGGIGSRRATAPQDYINGMNCISKQLFFLREVSEWPGDGNPHSTSTFSVMGAIFSKKKKIIHIFSPFILQIPSVYLFNMRLDVCPGKELLHVNNVLARQTHTYFLQQGSIFWYCYSSNW